MRPRPVTAPMIGVDERRRQSRRAKAHTLRADEVMIPSVRLPADNAPGHTVAVPDPQRELENHPLWEASSDGLVLVDGDGRVVATNSAFDRLFGYEDGALLMQPIDLAVPLPLQGVHALLRQNYETEPMPRPMAASRHLEGLRSDGSTFPVNVSLGRLETASGEHSFAAVHDLSNRIRFEAEAAKAKRHQAMAEERERIAHDLHDTVIQRLFALGIGLQGLPSQIEESSASAKVSAAVDTIDDVIDDLRSAIYGLRHPVSGEAPLREQILGILDEMRPSLGFSPDLHIVGDLDTLSDAAVIGHLLAVLREALSNTARHADATNATVSLEIDGTEVALEVIDDGVGLKENVARSGLSNLADRALALDGAFEVRRHTPSGTILRWAVPT